MYSASVCALATGKSASDLLAAFASVSGLPWPPTRMNASSGWFQSFVIVALVTMNWPSMPTLLSYVPASS